ncbi:Fur-regulated basic protein FbpA [Neobacillus sp. SM06]
MAKHLRTAIEKAKRYYIGKIIATGLYQSEQELANFTLSELEEIYQKSVR